MSKIRVDNDRLLSPGFVLGLTLVGFVVILNLTFGKNDYVSPFFLIMASWLIFLRVYDLRMGLRSFSADLFRKDSTMYRFLSKERSVPQFLLAAFFSVSLAIGMAVVLKTLTIVHSSFVVILIFSITCFAMRFFSSKDLVSEGMKGTVKNKKNGGTIQGLVRVVFCFLILNSALVVFLTAHDTHMFYNNEAGFSDFHEVAGSRAVHLSDYNFMSGPLINLSIILDSFRSSAVNEFMDAYDIDRGPVTYFMFFVVMMMMNFIKIIPFSLGAVLVYFSLRVRYIEKIDIFFDSAYKYAGLVFKKVNSKKEAKESGDEGE